MGRTLKHVPMDFDYPLNKVWYGAFIDCISTCLNNYEDESKCEQCKKIAEIKGINMTGYGCPDFNTYLEEPLKN